MSMRYPTTNTVTLDSTDDVVVWEEAIVWSPVRPIAWACWLQIALLHTTLQGYAHGRHNESRILSVTQTGNWMCTVVRTVTCFTSILSGDLQSALPYTILLLHIPSSSSFACHSFWIWYSYCLYLHLVVVCSIPCTPCTVSCKFLYVRKSSSSMCVCVRVMLKLSD